MERSSDVTSNEYIIGVLKENLQEAQKQALKWGIVFEVKIETVPAFCINIMAKNGKKAFVKHVSLSDVQYYADDPNALVNEVAEATYNALLKDMIREELRDPLKKAIINCNRMSTK